VKNKKTWFWVIGIGLVLVLMCANFVGLGLLVANSVGSEPAVGFGDAVAVVPVEGIILPGEAPPPSIFGDSGGSAYSQTIIDQLKRANEKSNIKAVILAVDSPGGSAYASEEISRQIKMMDKPVIASMGSLAASGGYYVSAPTDEIWASPSTLTCSIGVISQFPNLTKFAEEWGIDMITIKSGKFKDSGNPFREFTAEDRALWDAITEELYSAFVAVVAEGRGMSEKEVRALADGRVCTGRQALEMGLVDQLGYFDEAVERAAELGGIDGEPRLIEMNRSTGFFESLGGVFYRPGPVEQFRQVLRLNSGSPLMYLYTGP